ncbi:MAG: AroM family protein [Nitrososphaera sp.]
MAVSVLGLITLGQTPRPDLEVEFRKHAAAAEIRVAGALDGYSRDEAQRLAATPGDYPLLALLSELIASAS